MIELKINQASILIIDDNVTSAQLLEVVLKRSGYTNIHIENDSRKAIGAYRKYQPDLLLLDLSMPHVDGFQVMEQARECCGNDAAPIIVITEKTEYGNKLKSLRLGAKSFIHKPFHPKEIIMRIENTLEVHLLHKETQEQNRCLADKVQEQTKELQRLQIELLHRLMQAVEFRDNETGDHVSRMSWYCYELAKASGMPEAECLMLLHASKMHDVGKLAIPDHILLKPDKLTPGEWEVMKTHAIVGAKILAGSSFALLQLAETIAKTHHERWDGSGYPLGLSGESIPFVGRVVAICDVFDALQSKRPYKPAWPLADVVAELQNNSGKQFDPELVETFLQILPRLTVGKPENITANGNPEKCWW